MKKCQEKFNLTKTSLEIELNIDENYLNSKFEFRFKNILLESGMETIET